jgi:hypothetical protein
MLLKTVSIGFAAFSCSFVPLPQAPKYIIITDTNPGLLAEER